MKAILINAKEKTVSEIEISKDFREISKNIGCDCFTCAGTLPNGDTQYVDDEGLINGTEDFFFCPKLYPHPLAGNAVILGCDRQGESQSVKSSIADLGLISFMDRLDVAMTCM